MYGDGATLDGAAFNLQAQHDLTASRPARPVRRLRRMG